MESDKKNILDLSAWFLFNGERFLIRSAQKKDIEILRVWKNSNRGFFCHKEIITPEQQEKWFEHFSKQHDRQLFVCEKDLSLVACVGFKFIELPHKVELFNLICGEKRINGTGLMRVFFETLKTELSRKRVSEIELKVLKSNQKAIQWYFKQGFKTLDTLATEEAQEDGYCGAGVAYFQLHLKI